MASFQLVQLHSEREPTIKIGKSVISLHKNITCIFSSSVTQAVWERMLNQDN